MSCDGGHLGFLIAKKNIEKHFLESYLRNIRHTGDIYFSDIYIALSKLIAKKYIYLKIFWQGL
jgi:hypothetical protein